MASTLFFSCLGIASLYVFFTRRHSLALLLVIGFTQDSVRKLTPGEPVIFIVTVGVLFGFVLLGIWAHRGLAFSLEPFVHYTQKLRTPILLFLLILFVQLAYSLIRYNNLVVGMIGLITYLAPFLAVIVGYYLVDDIRGIKRFMYWYVAAGLLVALSVMLSFIGFDWLIFKEVGAGLKIYDQGTILKSYSGFIRTGEVAAWHISTTACLCITLAVSSEKPRSFFLVTAVVALLMTAIALTGRRKMLMLILLFVIFYFMTYLYYRKSLNAKYFFGVIGTLVVVWFGFELVNFSDYSTSLGNYIARSSSVFGDATGRFIQLGINPIQWAYNRVGLFGGGLGIASQGGYLFNSSNVAGGSGEGGLGKIMVELGLPGLLCVFWMLLSMARYIDKCLKLAAQGFVHKSLLPLMVSLTVFIGANAITFSVATQVYGDIFILIMLGLFGGFVFALPKIILNAVQRKGQQDELAHLLSQAQAHATPESG